MVKNLRFRTSDLRVFPSFVECGLCLGSCDPNSNNRNPPNSHDVVEATPSATVLYKDGKGRLLMALVLAPGNGQRQGGPGRIVEKTEMGRTMGGRAWWQQDPMCCRRC